MMMRVHQTNDEVVFKRRCVWFHELDVDVQVREEFKKFTGMSYVM